MKTDQRQFTLGQILHGYALATSARHLSSNTIEGYQRTFDKFTLFIAPETPFDLITRENIETFISGIENVTNSTLLHHYTALAALWTWAIRERLVSNHVVHSVTPPKPEQREIIPFTEAEFKLLVSVVSRSKSYERAGKRKSDHSLGSADRNRAILLMLLDTGLRASELCKLKLYQVDHRNSRIQVLGKGALERSVLFSPRTGQALWRYLSSRPNAAKEDPVFVTSLGRSLDRGQLANLVETIGHRAGVPNVHPHRFRHTFAIQYLRNGGDPYTLQKLLGHSTLDMVRKYLALAQIDLDKAHKRASPVDNWVL